jgi:hypothetical protein
VFGVAGACGGVLQAGIVVSDDEQHRGHGWLVVSEADEACRLVAAGERIGGLGATTLDTA